MSSSTNGNTNGSTISSSEAATEKARTATETHHNEDDSKKTKNEGNDNNDSIDQLSEKVSKLRVSLSPGDRNTNQETTTTKNLRQLAQWIQGSGKDNRPNILVLSGAGVSVAAGIPDFRSPGTGLYDNLQAYNLPYPEAVFDLNFYRRNPIPFVTLAKEIWPGLTHSPTLTHTFLELLANPPPPTTTTKNSEAGSSSSSSSLLMRNYTQNIDGLEILAKISAEKVVECHGHFRTSTCIKCPYSIDSSSISSGCYSGGDRNSNCSVLETIVHKSQVPRCSKCSNGIFKPDIVFFGEDLPARFGQCLKKDLRKCDLLLIMGTSLQVAPVCNIPSLVPRNCKRVVFDLQRPMGHRYFNFNTANNNNTRDLFIQGDCDTNVRTLCQFLGWEEELIQRNETTKIKQTMTTTKKN